ncbi:replication initiation protein RepC [Microvirga tunisiensis]|nr:replication initiation protein RepC [Microvirga tunisiensis]
MTARSQRRGFAAYAKTWFAIAGAADVTSDQVGISKSAWIKACDVVGNAAAATSVALIRERIEAHECASPSGDLRGLIKAAHVGELFLSKSLLRLAGWNAAAARDH